MRQLAQRTTRNGPFCQNSPAFAPGAPQSGQSRATSADEFMNSALMACEWKFMSWQGKPSAPHKFGVAL
jgi:hypothetical protein